MPTSVSDQAPDPGTANHDVWVLAGQSNMQGCGWLKGALAPDERVWSFSSAGQWQIANEPLHRLWESFTPVHQDLMRVWMLPADKQISDEEYARRENETRTIGSGLGLSFGSALSDALGKPIGLIPAAHGGTSLDQWSPKLKPFGGHSLYGGMLERIQRAGGRLRGILWYQGESDAVTADLGRSYAARLDEWIAAARADTGIPDLPFIAVQIGRVVEPPDRQGIWPGWNLVQEALRTLPDRVAHTAVTSAVDLPLVDLIHVNTGSLVRLGQRLAKLALKLTEGVDRPDGPAVEYIERITAPGGMCNAVRVHFTGVKGDWSRANNIRGFEARLPDAESRASLYAVNAWAEGTDIVVVFNREVDADARLGYGLGLNPACDLADADDMPLCAFLPQPIQ